MMLLEVKSLTKRFGGLIAVDELNFSIDKSEILGLIGPNGAGKSTIFNLITSYLKPTSGRILFQDKDITDLSTHDIARKGVVRTFQQNNLFTEMSVFQNLVLAHHALCQSGSWGHYFNSNRAKQDEQAFRESAASLINFFKIDHLKDELAKNLPHGYQRILGIAIGVAVNPSLLMLDEPFTGMNDVETETAIDLVRKLRDRGITIIIVEHNMRAVMRICERIVAINFGKKIAEGTPDEIQGNNRVIEAYIGKEEES